MDLDKLLKEKCIHPFRKGHATFKGYTLTPRYEELQEQLDNLEVNQNDIWVCTFPKCGTTWTQEMVWMITNNLNFEKGQKNIDERCPFVDFSVINDVRDWSKDHADYDPPAYVRNSIGYYRSLKSPLVVKSHLPFDLLPKEIRNGAKKPKMICVVRDPKDTCVSFYHHYKLLVGFKGNFEEFCELFLGGKVLYGPYWKHVLSYWKERDSPNFLFLKYKELKKDLPSVIRKVAKFLDRSLSEEQVEVLTEHLSFESMKKNPAVNREMIGEMNKKYKITDFEGKFMRSGKIGDYKTAMSDEMVQRFEDWTKKNTKNTGYVVWTNLAMIVS